jgi:phosphohistidine phosphatase SixA
MSVRFLLICLLSCLWLRPGHAQDAAWQALKSPAAILLIRHALAPGVGDPPGFSLQDCRTQRNLSEAGRAQARRIGERLRAENILVGQVLHSEWCRTRDTAQLAFDRFRPPQLRPDPRFNSFFEDRGAEPTQTAAARALLQGWRGPGVLVVVTHQVNIAALTGLVPDSGEGVVLQVQGDQWHLVGRVRP